MSWSDGSHYKGDWKKGTPNGLGNLYLIQEPLKWLEKRPGREFSKTTNW